MFWRSRRRGRRGAEHARRSVSRREQLDASELLRVPLPMPFGRALLLAPVEWSATGVVLTPKRLEELLEILHDTAGGDTSTHSVILAAPQAAEEEPECILSEEEDDESEKTEDEESELEDSEEEDEEDDI